jgi:hypothetical protein
MTMPPSYNLYEQLNGELWTRQVLLRYKPSETDVSPPTPLLHGPSPSLLFHINILDFGSPSLKYFTMARASEKAPLINSGSSPAEDKLPFPLGLVSPGVRPYLELFRFIR